MLPGRTPKADISFFIHLSFSRTWLSRCESDSRILSFVIYMVPERIFYLTPKWEIIQIIVISWDCNWLYYYFFCDNIYIFFFSVTIFLSAVGSCAHVWRLSPSRITHGYLVGLQIREAVILLPWAGSFQSASVLNIQSLSSILMPQSLEHQFSLK